MKKTGWRKSQSLFGYDASFYYNIIDDAFTSNFSKLSTPNEISQTVDSREQFAY
jgi:hypothetical protein